MRSATRIYRVGRSNPAQFLIVQGVGQFDRFGRRPLFGGRRVQRITNVQDGLEIVAVVQADDPRLS